MARPAKEGLTYFSLDCVLDSSVESLEVAFGNDGFAVYIKLLQEVYQCPKGELDISSALFRKTLAKRANVTEELWTEIIQTCAELELIEPTAFAERQIITSNGVKKRIKKVSGERKKWRDRKKKQEEFSRGKTSGKPREGAGITPQIEIENKSKSKKEIESKSKSINGEGAVAPPPTKKELDLQARANFKPPSAPEVISHFKAKDYNDPENEAQKFWNYYENADWRVGNKRIRMKDWHLAADNWNRNNKGRGDLGNANGIKHHNQQQQSAYQQRSNYKFSDTAANAERVKSKLEAIEQSHRDGSSGT